MKTLICSLSVVLVVLWGAVGFTSEKNEAPKTKAQTKCPVMGAAIDKDLYIDVNGKRIYLCCEGCGNIIKENPDKYIKAMEEKGIVVVRLNGLG